jgi:hypothetical protein
MEEALTALLANVAGGRRHWVRAPQNVTKPFIVLNRVSGGRDYHMQGPSGFVTSRVQCDIYGETYTSAKTTARALVAAVSGHRGPLIQGVFIDAERDLPAEDSGTVKNLFRVSIDLNITHSE